jgi:hypothetical protein
MNPVNKSYLSRFKTIAELKDQATALDPNSAKEAQFLLDRGALRFDVQMELGHVVSVQGDRFEMLEGQLLIYNIQGQAIAVFAKGSWTWVATVFPANPEGPYIIPSDS